MGVFSPKIPPKNQSHISFLTVWQHWLGIANHKNVFRSRPTSCYEILKISYFLLSDKLTNWQMPSAKHNSTMERATGLISSLLNITSSQDVPFHQTQQLHSKYHSATFVLLCSSYFCLQCKVSVYNSVKWLPTGFF